MLWTVLGIIAGLIVVFIIVVSMRPNSFRIERSTTIQAPPEKVFALINDFHPWTKWSPWEHMDPNLKRTYSGPASGVGAVYGWEGNKKVGTGRMEILESAPAQRVLIQLDFLKPFEAHNRAEFTLAQAGGGTRVNWAMYGPQNFMFKAMGLFMSMDKMVGKDFERGLASMKAAAEAA